jgi:hypothetical protein
MRRLGVLSAAFLLAMASACKRADAPPVSPSPAPAFADVTGIWSVRYRVLECGSTESVCHAALGSTADVTLRLEQRGGEMAGLFTAAQGSLTRAVVVPLAGQLLEAGVIQLAGTSPGAGFNPIDWQVRAMELRYNGNAGLAGTFEFVASGVPYYLRVRGEIVSAARRPLERDGFSGEWGGGYMITGCAISVGQHCQPDRVGWADAFTLSLTQTAGTVRGLMRSPLGDIEVTGTVSGSRIQLTGVRSSSDSGVRVAIIRWDAHRDQFGALHGTFAYSYERGSPLTAASVADAELRFVVLRP